MGDVIKFRIADRGTNPPEPYMPSSATLHFLASNKCIAVASTRIPGELKRYLMEEAFISVARFSEHLARILAEHVSRPRLHGLVMARPKESIEESEQERAA